MLYLLSHSDAVNVLDTPENDLANSVRKRKRGDGESSSELWHYRLIHISMGRIEVTDSPSLRCYKLRAL
jgi:hypothetical protein